MPILNYPKTKLSFPFLAPSAEHPVENLAGHGALIPRVGDPKLFPPFPPSVGLFLPFQLFVKLSHGRTGPLGIDERFVGTLPQPDSIPSRPFASPLVLGGKVGLETMGHFPPAGPVLVPELLELVLQYPFLLLHPSLLEGILVRVVGRPDLNGPVPELVVRPFVPVPWRPLLLLLVPHHSLPLFVLDAFFPRELFPPRLWFLLRRRLVPWDRRRGGREQGKHSHVALDGF